MSFLFCSGVSHPLHPTTSLIFTLAYLIGAVSPKSIFTTYSFALSKSTNSYSYFWIVALYAPVHESTRVSLGNSYMEKEGVYHVDIFPSIP
jgi:hypothetical protein